MTEDQIERKVERMFNALDAQFMGGKLTREEYDDGTQEISAWADAQYRQAAA